MDNAQADAELVVGTLYGVPRNAAWTTGSEEASLAAAHKFAECWVEAKSAKRGAYSTMNGRISEGNAAMHEGREHCVSSGLLTSADANDTSLQTAVGMRNACFFTPVPTATDIANFIMSPQCFVLAAAAWKREWDAFDSLGQGVRPPTDPVLTVRVHDRQFHFGRGRWHPPGKLSSWRVREFEPDRARW